MLTILFQIFSTPRCLLIQWDKEDKAQADGSAQEMIAKATTTTKAITTANIYNLLLVIWSYQAV